MFFSVNMMGMDREIPTSPRICVGEGLVPPLRCGRDCGWVRGSMTGIRSNRRKRNVWHIRQFNAYLVAGRNISIDKYDRHHPGVADEVAISVTVDSGGHQTGLDPVELRAGIAQSGDFHDGVFADMKRCS